MGVNPLVTVFLCLLAFFNVKVSGLQLDSKELDFADIPACGLQCFFIAIPSTECATADIDCICASDSLKSGMAACLLAKCTMQDSLDASRVQAKLCNLSEESKTRDVILSTSIVYSIAILSVVLRIAGKAVSKRLAWDDVVVTAALLLAAIPLGCVCDMVTNGFGKHLWNLEDGKLLPILRCVYISWLMYSIVLCMIKVSLVLFYLEIFRTRRFQITAYIFLAYLITSNLVILGLTIFACNPVPSFWNRDIKGKCINIQAAAYANSGSAVVQDIMLLILPLVFTRNLQMKRYRKIAVGFMFVIGALGCIATLMRLPSLSTFKISIDPSWDYVSATIWTELELLAGILCVSLPSIRMLLVTLFPKRVKELLSNITHPSRSKSNPTPQPQQAAPQGQRRWNVPSYWIDISANSTNASEESPGKDPEPSSFSSRARDSFIGALWYRSSTQLPRSSHLRNGNQRPTSVISYYSEPGIAAARPLDQEERKTRIFEQVEMSNVLRKARRHSVALCRSCSGDEEHIIALSQIGCIPEGSYSDMDLTKSQSTRTTQWLLSEKEMP